MNRLRALIAHHSSLITLCLLAGCTVGPDYERPSPNLPETWTGTAAPGGRSVTTEPAELRQWWTNFDDTELTDLIDLALVNSPDLTEAAGRVLENRYLRAATVGELLPHVDADASYTRSRQSETIGDGFSGFATGEPAGDPLGGASFDPESDLWQAGLALNWELDVFGRLRRRVEAADRELQAELADFYAVRVALAADVGLAYVEVRELQNRLQIAQANAQTQRDSLELARARYENGLTTELDVAEAVANLQQTLAQVPALAEQLQAAKNRLSLLTGQVPGAVDRALTEVEPVPVPPEEVAVGVPIDLLRRRPDVHRAERDLAAAVARVGAAQADLYPRFTLAGSFGFASDELEDVFDWDSRTFSVGPSVTWPIFQGGTLRALVMAQDAVVLQRAAAYEQTVLTALNEVSDALTAYARDREQRLVLADAVEAARRAVELAETQYTQGLVGFDRVLDAQRTLFLAEDSLAIVDASVSADLIRLYRALGGGWDAPPPNPPTTQPAT